MSFLSVETLAEQTCISKMVYGKLIKNPILFILYIKYELGLNGGDLLDSYWTAGSDEFHEGIFKWCSTLKAENLSTALKFKVGEPNNGGGAENCIQSTVSADPLPDNFLYSDINCNNTQRYICEESPL